MSVQSEIDRIKANVAAAYSAVEGMGGNLPEEQNSANLAAAIQGIPAGGGGSALQDPLEVYKNTRPDDWLPMPEPQDDEMYLLFHIPDGASSLLAFTVTCTGSCTVAVGTVENGAFVQSDAVSVASGEAYEAELSADDFGDLTSTGMKQCMVKVSGTDILTWEPSVHSGKTAPANFAGWNIVEISCRLPEGTKAACGNSVQTKALSAMRYFSWYGGNNAADINCMFRNCYALIAVLRLDTATATNMSYMFSDCRSLVAVPQLDTANGDNMSSMFSGCYSLTAIPQLDTANATNMSYMFGSCYSLAAIPQLDTGNVTNMSYMFGDCRSLATVPQLDTAKVKNTSYMFNCCYSLTAIPQLDTSKATNMNYMFGDCYSLAKLTLKPTVTGWAGYVLNLTNCSLSHQALVDLFNSLPIITAAKKLMLTGNPGVSGLTEAEKNIALGKNWTLTL